MKKKIINEVELSIILWWLKGKDSWEYAARIILGAIHE